MHNNKHPDASDFLVQHYLRSVSWGMWEICKASGTYNMLKMSIANNYSGGSNIDI